jgi:Bacteriophage baseplate protein W
MRIQTWMISDGKGNMITSTAALNLGAVGLEEVLQNVMIICSSRVGDQVADRRFGTRWNFIDAPQNIAPMLVLQEVLAAINYYEPRCTFRNIRFLRDESNFAVTICQITISIDPSQLAVGITTPLPGLPQLQLT